MGLPRVVAAALMALIVPTSGNTQTGQRRSHHNGH